MQALGFKNCVRTGYGKVNAIPDYFLVNGRYVSRTSSNWTVTNQSASDMPEVFRARETFLTARAAGAFVATGAQDLDAL